MTDVASHYLLLATALPSEERRIRTWYLPTLVLVVVVPTAVFAALGVSKGATPKTMTSYGLMMAAYIAYLVVLVSAQNEAPADSVLGNI